MTALSPLAGTDDVQLLQAYEAAQIIADWKKVFQTDISDEFAGYDKIHLHLCNRTGLKFFAPPVVAGSAKYYGYLQGFAWYYLPDLWEHGLALKRLSGAVEVLEVGAGKGAFVVKCMEKGIGIVGLEPNAAALPEAPEKFLPLVNTDLASFVNGREETFDAVCSFQVLELVSDPKAFLGNMVRVLKQGGSLIISVPNADSVYQHDCSLLDLPPHHMTQWSRRSLASLTNFFPLRLREVIYEPLAACHVRYYVSACSSLLDRRLRTGVLPDWLAKTAIAVLNAGLRKMIRGQSMLVRYQKI